MPSHLRLPTAVELRARHERELAAIRAERLNFRCAILNYLRSL